MVTLGPKACDRTIAYFLMLGNNLNAYTRLIVFFFFSVGREKYLSYTCTMTEIELSSVLIMDFKIIAA